MTTQPPCTSEREKKAELQSRAATFALSSPRLRIPEKMLVERDGVNQQQTTQAQIE
jgi:hypothetical protein